MRYSQESWETLSRGVMGGALGPGAQPTMPSALGSPPTTALGSSALSSASLGLGLAASVFGMLGQAVGSFYAAKSAQYQMRSQASSARFQARMADRTASRLEVQAQSLLEAGAQQSALYSIRAGQERASAEVGVAARGLQAGVGSARDLMATLDYSREADRYVISANAVRAAESSRLQRVDAQNASMMAGVQADNLELTAANISPTGMFLTSLLGSAGAAAPQWAMLASKY